MMYVFIFIYGGEKAKKMPGQIRVNPGKSAAKTFFTCGRKQFNCIDFIQD